MLLRIINNESTGYETQVVNPVTGAELSKFLTGVEFRHRDGRAPEAEVFLTGVEIDATVDAHVRLAQEAHDAIVEACANLCRDAGNVIEAEERIRALMLTRS